MVSGHKAIGFVNGCQSVQPVSSRFDCEFMQNCMNTLELKATVDYPIWVRICLHNSLQQPVSNQTRQSMSFNISFLIISLRVLLK